MTTLSLPITEAVRACAAVLPHISTDVMTPVLNAAHVKDEWLTATDRYTVARHVLPAGSADGEMMIPLDAVKWVARFPMKQLLGMQELYILRVTQDERKEVTAELVIGDEVEQLRRFRGVSGSFPLVAKLFDAFEPAEEAEPVALSVDSLSKFTAFARTYVPGVPIHFFPSKREASKPGPMRVKFPDFEALVQPSIFIKQGTK